MLQRPLENHGFFGEAKGTEHVAVVAARVNPCHAWRNQRHWQRHMPKDIEIARPNLRRLARREIGRNPLAQDARFKLEAVQRHLADGCRSAGSPEYPTPFHPI